MASARLWRAIRKDDLLQVDEILSPLSEAERVELLNSRTQKGELILHTAIQVASSEVVQAILGYRELDVDIYDGEYGYTPIIAAVAFGADVHVLQTLLSRAPTLTLRDKTEAANSALHWAAAMNHTAGLDELLKYKKEYRDILNAHQETPLHAAIREGQGEAAILLIDRKSNVNAKDEHGEGPLHLAVRSRMPEVVQALLETDQIAVDEYIDNNGDTPLHIACQTQQTRVAGLLTEFGFSLDKRNYRNVRPCDLIEQGKENEEKNLLQKDEARKNRAIRRREARDSDRDVTEVTQLMQKYGASPEAIQILFDKRYHVLDDDFWNLKDEKLRKLGVVDSAHRQSVLLAIQRYSEELKQQEEAIETELRTVEARSQRNRVLILFGVLSVLAGLLYAGFKFELFQKANFFLKKKGWQPSF